METDNVSWYTKENWMVSIITAKILCILYINAKNNGLFCRHVTSFQDQHDVYCSSKLVDNNITSAELATLLGKDSAVAESLEDTREQMRKFGYATLAKKSNKFVDRVHKEQKQAQMVDFGFSFSLLESKIKCLYDANPGSVFCLQSLNVTKEDSSGEEKSEKRFYRLACALSYSIDVAKNCCKPVISLDAGALKHLCWPGYQVFVLGMQNGENKDHLLAMAIVPAEDEENYKWFLRCLKQNTNLRSVLEDPMLVAITDRSKGLANALQAELPSAHHRYCALHLMRNVPRLITEMEKSIYWKIVKSNSPCQFEAHMKDLQKVNSAAHDYLSQIQPCLWVDYAQPEGKSSWGLTTNNLAERSVKIMGSDSNKGRTLCPLQIIDRFMEQNAKQRENMLTLLTANRELTHDDDLHYSRLGNEIRQLLWRKWQDYNVSKPSRVIDFSCQPAVTVAARYKVWMPFGGQARATGYNHREDEDEDRHSVTKFTAVDKVNRYKCTCKQRSTMGFPCVHICAVYFQSENPTDKFLRNIPFEVHRCYIASNLRNGYGSPVDEAFSSANLISQSSTLPPVARKVSKSLLGKRIRSRGSSSGGRPLKGCSRCNNSLTCIHQMAPNLRMLSKEDAIRYVNDINDESIRDAGNAEIVTDFEAYCSFVSEQEEEKCEEYERKEEYNEDDEDDVNCIADNIYKKKSDNLFEAVGNFLSKSISTVYNYVGNTTKEV